MQTSGFRSAGALVAELFAIIDGQRWDELGNVLTDDCVVDRPGAPQLVGIDRVTHFYRHERAIASGRHQLEHVVSDICCAACWGRFTGQTQRGQAVDERFAETYLVRGGKVERRTTYLLRPAG